MYIHVYLNCVPMHSLPVSGPGSGSASPGKKSGGGGGDVEEGGGAQGGGTTGAGGASNKPHLRVVIPGQKEFVPRTVSRLS